jgi:hypothetical protein
MIVAVRGGSREILLYVAERSSAAGRQSRMECDLDTSVSLITWRCVVPLYVLYEQIEE